MLHQRQQQRLLQKLSPQQVLVMRLLQQPVLSLEQRIKQEIEDNPALEEADDIIDTDEITDETTPESIDADEDSFTDDDDDHNELKADNEFSYEDYLDPDDIPDYKLFSNNRSADDEAWETPVVSGVSSQEYLLAQMGVQKIPDIQFVIASTIIGNLDENGYLAREIPALINDLAFNQNIEVTEEEVLQALMLVQGFDPPGIAARSLQECLLLQLTHKPDRTYSTDLAEVIVRYYFDEFSKKHYDKILQKAHISEEELKEAIEEITKLNPKPGFIIGEEARSSQYVVPDFLVSLNDGELELNLNSRNTPELSINREYYSMLREYNKRKKKISSTEKAAMTFIKQKIDSARGFIDAIRQRQETLYFTMKAILDYQKEYFQTGDETRLKPMILKDISNKVGLDISTVSRVANSKYVQTPFGTFLLKSFFSESLQNSMGEEISTREIKKILNDIVEGENKSSPLTDEELEEILQKKGYTIARRTIAKYRKQLRIPVARLRKEL
ncbi:MAG: RNA polymerase factor sigma-54 [Bacteroidetes bacterium]|nr:RNA polymerase factor sigma-54 [Bacteroidota bacterium]